MTDVVFVAVAGDTVVVSVPGSLLSVLQLSTFYHCCWLSLGWCCSLWLRCCGYLCCICR